MANHRMIVEAVIMQIDFLVRFSFYQVYSRMLQLISLRRVAKKTTKALCTSPILLILDTSRCRQYTSVEIFWFDLTAVGNLGSEPPPSM